MTHRALRLRAGITLFVLSWFPFAQLIIWATAMTEPDAGKLRLTIWAIQFLVGLIGIALAGADQVSDKAGLMVKVDDLDAEIERIQSLGGVVGEPQEGAHEVRAVAEGPGGWPVVLYASKG